MKKEPRGFVFAPFDGDDRTARSAFREKVFRLRVPDRTDRRYENMRKQY